MSGPVMVVPPLVKYLAGPLAGPAVLAGVASTLGVPLRVFDPNAQFLRERQPGPSERGPITGDHAKPPKGFGEASNEMRDMLRQVLGPPLPGAAPGEDPVFTLCYDHEAVHRAAARLAASETGSEWRRMLQGPPPHFFGVSVLWSGQVVPALAVSRVARQLWPGVPVIWGGPHVTALAASIAGDAAFGQVVDGFVVGYGEAAVKDLLTLDNPLESKLLLCAGKGSVETGEDHWCTPQFSDLHLYGIPRLVLPCQLSRGCAYGRCAFCTYPAQEGRYRACSLDLLDPVLGEAIRTSADLSIKDAFLVPERAEKVATMIAGRVNWSATSRLLPAYKDHARMERLVQGGLRTLELGVESLNPHVQVFISKPQNMETLEGVLAAASGSALHLILNVIHGWPGESLRQALEARKQLDELLSAHPQASVTVEQNLLQPQLNAPLFHQRRQLGVQVTGRWPWASVVGWNAPRWRAEVGHHFQGHRHMNSEGHKEAA